MFINGCSCICIYTYACVCVYILLSLCMYLYTYTHRQRHFYKYLKLNLAFPQDLFTLTCFLSCLMTPCRFVSQKPPFFSLPSPTSSEDKSHHFNSSMFQHPTLFPLLPGSDLVIPSHDSFIKSFLSTYPWPGALSGSEDTAVNKQTKILSLIDLTINK